MRRLAFSLPILAMLLFAGCVSFKSPADWTRGAPSVCEVHGTQMTKTIVPIAYGLMGLSEWGKAHEAASRTSFPHAEEVALGGCIVGTSKQALIYVCPQCQWARQQWESENPKPRKYTIDFVAGEWIGLDRGWRAEVFRLLLKPDNTGELAEAAKVSTNGVNVYRYEISRWEIAANDVLQCEFNQRDIHEPLRMTCTVTGVEGNSLTALLDNGEGGWKQDILFWRAKDLDEKLKILKR